MLPQPSAVAMLPQRRMLPGRSTHGTAAIVSPEARSSAAASQLRSSQLQRSKDSSSKRYEGVDVVCASAF